jgi:hypothetical protein
MNAFDGTEVDEAGAEHFVHEAVLLEPGTVL